MFNFPIFLNLETLPCLVVGAGPVGLRKARKLLSAGAKRVCLLAASKPGPEEAELKGVVGFERKTGLFASEHLKGFCLVFAATNNPELNAEICRLGQEMQILCSNASDPENGEFITPASLQSQGFTLAVSNVAASPTLSRLVCAELAESLSPRHMQACELLAQIRPWLLSLKLAPETRKEILNCLAELALVSGLDSTAQNRLKQIVPPEYFGELWARLQGRLYDKAEAGNA